jgi:hypothetical protein
MTLSHARTNDGTETVWAVYDANRAVSMTIIRGTSEGVYQAQALSVHAARFTDAETGTVLAGVYEHRRVSEDHGSAQVCTHLGHCDLDRFVSLVANPLFKAAAADKFLDVAVFDLLTKLHGEVAA